MLAAVTLGIAGVMAFADNAAAAPAAALQAADNISQPGVPHNPWNQPSSTTRSPRAPERW